MLSNFLTFILMRAELVKTVIDAGLSDKAARVYLAALSLGPSTVQQLARQADVKRTTVYPIFEDLERLGLMSVQLHGFKKRYAAEDPKRLFSLIESRRQNLLGSLSELSALFALQSGESAIKHFKEADAIKTVYCGLIEDINQGEEYLIISSGADLVDLDPEFFQEFFERRSTLDITVRTMLTRSDFNAQYAEQRKESNEVVCILPDKVKFSANIVITPQRVLIHQLQDPGWAVVIENAGIVRTFKELFEMGWRSLQ